MHILLYLLTYVSLHNAQGIGRFHESDNNLSSSVICIIHCFYRKYNT